MTATPFLSRNFPHRLFHMVAMKLKLKIVLLLTCFLITGCNNGNVPLSGTVTFSDDNSPLTVGAVSFEGSSVRAFGTLDGKGHYVVGTEKERDGIPPGTYKIALIGAGTTGERMEYQQLGQTVSGMAKFIPVVDTKYTSTETSGLSLTVDHSTKTFDFQVDRFKK